MGLWMKTRDAACEGSRGRVLHVHNVAGVSSNLAFFQRKLGWEAKVITRIVHPYCYDEDYYPHWKNLFPLRFFQTFDVIHYHGNTWFRRRELKHFDYHLCKRFHRKIVIHFHGSDLRIESMYKELKNIIDDLKIILVSTPDLLTFLPPEKGVWLPSPINIEMWHPKPTIEKERALVIGYYNPPHLQSEWIYCTKHIETAIKNLKRKGFEIETNTVYGKPHSAMPSYYSSIDVFVDRLGIGWYGLNACEAMASGLPLITYIREDLRQLLPRKEPFLISPKEKLEENLEMILSDESLRKQLAQRGRQYVSDTHDGLRVAKRLIDIYQRL